MTNWVLLRFFFFYNKSISSRKRHMFLQIGKKSFLPLPPPPCGDQNRYPRRIRQSKTWPPWPLPQQLGWGQHSHKISFDLEVLQGWFQALEGKEQNRLVLSYPAHTHPQWPGPHPSQPQLGRGQRTWSLGSGRPGFESQPWKGGAPEYTEAHKSRGCLIPLCHPNKVPSSFHEWRQHPGWLWEQQGGRAPEGLAGS